MITRDISVISMTSQVSLSLSLSLSLLLTKVTHAQYRKRFRASYNTNDYGHFFKNVVSRSQGYMFIRFVRHRNQLIAVSPNKKKNVLNTCGTGRAE